MRAGEYSCDGDHAREEETYAFFAQLNMIADVIERYGVVYRRDVLWLADKKSSRLQHRLPFQEGMIGDAQPPVAANLKLYNKGAVQIKPNIFNVSDLQACSMY
jgi:hypothetical protein